MLLTTCCLVMQNLEQDQHAEQNNYHCLYGLPPPTVPRLHAYCSVSGWFHWQPWVANEDGRGACCVCMSCCWNQAVLNTTVGSTNSPSSLWALAGRRGRWSKWQIKAGNCARGVGGRAGGWRGQCCVSALVYVCVCVCRRILLLPGH